MRGAEPGHPGRGEHLSGVSPARRLRDPHLLRRERQVGSVPHHLEPARLSRDPHRRGRDGATHRHVGEELARPELNNFRQNVPGDPNGNAVPDATAGAALFDSCSGGEAILEVDVCNRGAAPQAAGVNVGFYVMGALVCQTQTSMPLGPEECERVGCTWTTPPQNVGSAVDVDVVANDGGGISECKEGNNAGVVQDVWCSPPS